ncbi:MAG: ChaN family lipoprotein [Campylobacterota bacterium]|nr:ChaN family lipoprotein [Campylobacterota bacterium]
MIRMIFLFFVALFFMACEKELQPPRHEKVCSEFYDLKREQCDTIESFVTKLEPYKVIFIGDHHDSKALHVKIAEMIKILQKRGFEVSLANEWFTPSDNALLHEYSLGSIDNKTFEEEIDWKKKVGYPMESFLPMYEAIKEGNGFLYGINLSREERKLVSDKNSSAMSPDLLKFYKNLDLNTRSHQQLLEPFFRYCHGSKKGEDALTCKERMYRVQVAWDTKMAQESVRLEEKLMKDSKAKLIVFAGAFHLVSHLGINMRFSRESSALHVTLLPHPKPQEAIDLGRSDFIYFYDDKNASKSAKTL